MCGFRVGLLFGNGLNKGAGRLLGGLQVFCDCCIQILALIPPPLQATYLTYPNNPTCPTYLAGWIPIFGEINTFKKNRESLYDNFSCFREDRA